MLLNRRLCALLPAWMVLLAAAAIAGPHQQAQPGSQQVAETPGQLDAQAPQALGGERPGDVPVTLDGQTLFYVRNPLGPFSVLERAARAEAVILHIARDPFYSPDLIRIESRGGDAIVFYRDEQVGSATQGEALERGVTAQQLSERTVQVVKEAVSAYRLRQRPKAWLRAVLYLVLASVALALAIIGLQRGARRLIARTQNKPLEADGKASTASILGVHTHKLSEVRARLLLWGRNLAILFACLLYLQVAFWALPFTHGLALGLLRYLTQPLESIFDSFLTHVGDLFFIAVIVVLFRLILRFMNWLAREAASGAIQLPLITRDTAMAAYKVLRIAVLAIAGMMIYPYIPGSSSAAFKGIGLFAGALFTLGASATANSLIGGVTLIFTDVYRLGDRVRIGEVTGNVIEITLLITRLRTTKNEIVSLSNGGVLADRVVNYSKEARGLGLVLHTSVTIGYDVPWRQVHELLEQAARSTEGIEREPAPFVLQTSLDDFYVSYQLNAITHDANSMPRMYSELHARIQDEFNAAGVEIMSPHYAAHRDGALSTVPADQRPGDEPRPFVVRVAPQ